MRLEGFGFLPLEGHALLLGRVVRVLWELRWRAQEQQKDREASDCRETCPLGPIGKPRCPGKNGGLLYLFCLALCERCVSLRLSRKEGLKPVMLMELCEALFTRPERLFAVGTVLSLSIELCLL